MPYQPLAVANEMIDLHGQGGAIDHLKLQKLMYFANGWHLAVNGIPMMSTNPQVWRYGPVFQWLYNVFSKYGRSPIVTPEAPSLFGGAPMRVDDANRDYVRHFLNWIWNEYGAMSGVQLSDLTHAPDTPWYKIASKNGFLVGVSTEIPPQEDYEYFAGLARQRGIPTQPLRA